jgi:hypothetical protein
MRRLSIGERRKFATASLSAYAGDILLPIAPLSPICSIMMCSITARMPIAARARTASEQPAAVLLRLGGRARPFSPPGERSDTRGRFFRIERND